MPARRNRRAQVRLIRDDPSSPLVQPSQAMEFARRLREQAIDNLKADSRAAQDVLDAAVDRGLEARDRLAAESGALNAPAYLTDFVTALSSAEEPRINPRDFQKRLDRILNTPDAATEQLLTIHDGAFVDAYVGFTIKAARFNWFSQHELHHDIHWARVPELGAQPDDGPLPRDEHFTSELPAELTKLYQSATIIDQLDNGTAEALRIAIDEYVGFTLSNIGARTPGLTQQGEFIPPAQIMLTNAFKVHQGMQHFLDKVNPAARDDIAAIHDARVTEAVIQTAIVAIEDLPDRRSQSQLLTQATKYAELAIDPDLRNTIFKTLKSFAITPLADRGAAPTRQQPPAGPELP